VDQGRLERMLASLHGTDAVLPVLRRICVVCAQETDLDGAGVSRIFDGQHEVLGSSGSDAEAVEHLQATTGEGPCRDAVHTRRPCLEADLTSSRANDRWPEFCRGALEHGVVAVFAFPLIAHGVTVGALDLYARVPGELGNAQFDDALLLADLAAIAVRDGADNAIEAAGIATESAEPWAHSAVVHNACGMMSEQLGISVEDALLRLRTFAFVTERAVADIARDVVSRRLRIEGWGER
jgi:hypothetical protein